MRNSPATSDFGTLLPAFGSFLCSELEVSTSEIWSSLEELASETIRLLDELEVALLEAVCSSVLPFLTQC